MSAIILSSIELNPVDSPTICMIDLFSFIFRFSSDFSSDSFQILFRFFLDFLQIREFLNRSNVFLLLRADLLTKESSVS